MCPKSSMRTIDISVQPSRSSRLPPPAFRLWQFWRWPLWRSRKFHLALASILVIFGLLAGLAYIVAKPFYDQAQTIEQTVDRLKLAVKEQRIDHINTELPVLKQQLSDLDKHLQSYAIVESLPFVDHYYTDARHLLQAADQGLEGGMILADAITPYADIIGFKTDQATATLKPQDNEDRVAQLVLLIPAVLPALDKSTANFDQVTEHISAIDPDKYPRQIAGYDLRQTIADTQSQITNLTGNIRQIRPVLEVLPDVLGANKAKRYLLVFQNDKELRPTGGFISSVAYVTFKEGKFSVSESQDIYSVDKEIAYLPVPWPMTAYNQTAKLTLRDTNWSPDFAESMADFELYYRRYGHSPIDGIIALDTQFVEELMKMTGPIQVPGYRQPFSAEPIDVNGVKIPQVVYQLEVIAQKVGLQGDDRKGVIGDLMKLIIEKVLADPPTKWPDYLTMLTTVGQEKHLLLSFHDDKAQQQAENFNFAGRIAKPQANTDYLHINDANLAGLKTNFYLQQRTTQEINIAADGTITKKLTITYTNTGKFDGWISATARNYTRVYVPQGSKLLKSSGGQQRVNTTEDLGYTVFDNFTTVKALASQTMTFEYRLPFKAELSDYKLLIQKQAGAQNWHYTTILGHQEVKTYLDGDKELHFDL